MADSSSQSQDKAMVAWTALLVGIAMLVVTMIVMRSPSSRTNKHYQNAPAKADSLRRDANLP